MNPSTSSTISQRRSLLGRIVLFVLIVAGLAALDGNQRQATSAASGTSFDGPPAATRPGALLRVATFNMNRQLDPVRTVSALGGFDLIALEEVGGGGLLGGKDQTQILGQALQLPWLFAPVERRWWHDDFGNGALTDLPVDHWQRLPFSSAAAATNRNLVLLRLEYQGKPLNVIVTHLDRQGDHDAELAGVLELFQSLEKPVILLGDLNSEPADRRIEQLRSLARACGIDPTKNRNDGLDWVLARGMHARDWGLKNTGASDHLLAWAELEMDRQ